MAEKSGFFPDIDGDREYTSEWLAKYIAGIISNGVYTTELTVTGGNGDMSVNVGAGRAWINGYMYSNDSPLKLTLSNADGTMNRIDLVVLRLDMTNRQISTKIVQGNYAATPTAPVLTRTSDIYELELAQISVAAGTTAITNLMITDKRADETVCGIVCGAVTQFSTGDLLNQLKAGFDRWFENIQGQLSSDVAGHLQNEIDGISAASIGALITPISGTSAPTASTIGTIGQRYIDNDPTFTSPGLYECVAASGGVYTWKCLTSYKNLSSYAAFCANVNTASLDAAFGKGNEDLINNLGVQSAMYSWFNGADKTKYQFNTLKTKETITEIFADKAALAELMSEANLSYLLKTSPYINSKITALSDADLMLMLNFLCGTRTDTTLSNLLTTSSELAKISASEKATTLCFSNQRIVNVGTPYGSFKSAMYDGVTTYMESLSSGLSTIALSSSPLYSYMKSNSSNAAVSSAPINVKGFATYASASCAGYIGITVTGLKNSPTSVSVVGGGDLQGQTNRIFRFISPSGMFVSQGYNSTFSYCIMQ